MLVGQKAVDKIGEVKISGDIIANSWKHVIVDKNGNADMIAIAVYARLVYWCRPGKDGKKKFDWEMVHMTYKDFEEQCNLSYKQVKRAIAQLEKLGLIYTVKKYMDHNGTKGTYKYFMVNPEKYSAITTDKYVVEASCSKFAEKCTVKGHPPEPQGPGGDTLEGQTPVPQKTGGVALEGSTKTKNNKNNQKERKAVGFCPFCGEKLYEIEKKDGTVFFGHLDGYKANARCNATFSSIAEINGYNENPKQNDMCAVEMPEEVRQEFNKLMKKMSID